jgi:hypothetical protein
MAFALDCGGICATNGSITNLEKEIQSSRCNAGWGQRGWWYDALLNALIEAFGGWCQLEGK